MKRCNLSFTVVVGILTAFLGSPALAQVKWVPESRMVAANGGILPNTQIHGVMKPTDQPDQLEFHFKAIVSAGFEADIYSMNNPGKALVHVIGGLQPKSVDGLVRETQQRVRIKNLYSDSTFMLTLKDTATGRMARVMVGQGNLSKPFVVYFANQPAAPEAGVGVKQSLVLAGGCEWTCALSEDGAVCGYGRIGSCVLNLVTCSVSGCDESGC